MPEKDVTKLDTALHRTTHQLTSPHRTVPPCRDMPQLPEQEDEEEEGGGISLWEGGVGGDGSGYTGPFEESERYLLNFSCPKKEGTYARLHVRTPKQGTTAPSTIDYDVRKFQGAFFFLSDEHPNEV